MITRDTLNNASHHDGYLSTDHSNCIHDDRNDDDREQMLTISSEEFVWSFAYDIESDHGSKHYLDTFNNMKPSLITKIIL